MNLCLTCWQTQRYESSTDNVSTKSQLPQLRLSSPYLDFNAVSGFFPPDLLAVLRGLPVVPPLLLPMVPLVAFLPPSLRVPHSLCRRMPSPLLYCCIGPSDCSCAGATFPPGTEVSSHGISLIKPMAVQLVLHLGECMWIGFGIGLPVGIGQRSWKGSPCSESVKISVCGQVASR